MNCPGKKTIGFVVPVEYQHTGNEFREAVDKLFEAIWNELPAKKQSEIAQKFERELEILNWRCE